MHKKSKRVSSMFRTSHVGFDSCFLSGLFDSYRECRKRRVRFTTMFNALCNPAALTKVLIK